MRNLQRLASAHRINLLLFIAIAVVGSIFFFHLSRQVPAEILDENRRPANIWFQADAGRIFDNMTSRWGNHSRTDAHPLFSLIANPPTLALQKLGLPAPTAVRSVVSATAGLSLSVLFAVLTMLGLRRLDAAIFVIVSAFSASYVFLATVPETFLFGTLAIATAMLVPAAATRVPVARVWQTAANAVSLGLAVTNWILGILSALVLNSGNRFLRICRDGFLVVTVFWCIEKAIFPSARFFLMNWEKSRPLPDGVAGNLLEKALSFFGHSVAIPVINRIPDHDREALPYLSVEKSAVLSHDPIGIASLAIWLLILAIGIVAACAPGSRRKFFLVIGGALAGQFLLRLFADGETFLHSPHWLPLLIAVAAAGTLTPYRKPVVAAAAVLTILLGVNNLGRFSETTTLVATYKAEIDVTDERSRVRAAMRAHPEADWPRGTGHVVLGVPGAGLAAKGYHEPGGGFSPGFGSFGISFVLFDANGKLAVSSNRLPLRDIDQRLEETGPDGRYRLRTGTGFYVAEWEATGNGTWRLSFRTPAGSNLTPVIRITSAGPAGGPLRTVHRNGAGFGVNGEWSITFDRQPERAGLDSEFAAPVFRPPQLDLSGGRADIPNEDGFAALSFELEAGRAYVAEIRRGHGAAETLLNTTPKTRLELEIPDRRFEDSLRAQMVHLKMGLVGDQTRPGDPAHYPLEWLRDGAYTVVALARAGGGAYVTKLAMRFAEGDFFGGFASEADAPGLAIWALEEVASRHENPDFSRKIWPHIKRKAEIILEMIAARDPVHKPFRGLIDPSLRNRSYSYLTRIALPRADGLIVGKMDEHQPIFFVNAVSYLGLQRAARLAETLGHHAEARSWRDHAATLRKAWRAALPWHKNRTNSRTLISGIWPSAIVHSDDHGYRALLDEHWERHHHATAVFKESPKYTYFDIAEAHQWLMSGQPETTWEILRWFWRHQVSPGLYTWWEDSREQTPYGLWQTVRGWVEPRHVTPHYWTTAETLLLQLAMLAYDSAAGADLDCSKQDVVIGGGVPKDWLGKPLVIRGLSLRCGQLDWMWDGRALLVAWHGGAHGRFLAGPSFPIGVEIRKVATLPAR